MITDGGTETITDPYPPIALGLVDNTVLVGTSVDFLVEETTSSLNHFLQYQMDWGDSTYSTWSDATAIWSHSWGPTGTYPVSLQACCAAHPTVVSDWSTATLINVIEEVFDTTAPQDCTVTQNGGDGTIKTEIIELTLTGTDVGFGINGYLLEDHPLGVTPAPPLPDDSDWVAVTPTNDFNANVDCTLTNTYIANEDVTLYLWCKDAADNVSESASLTVTAISPDPPTNVSVLGGETAKSL